MNRIQFKTKAAQHIYDDFMLRLEKNTTALSATEQLDIIMEFNSHFYEGTKDCSETTEINVVLELVKKLGMPEEFLKPLVAKKKLEKAVNTFNPRDIFQAIVLNIRNGFIFSVFGLLYLFLGAFVILVFMKMFFPAQTGLFYRDHSFSGFGFIGNSSGSQEILGYWIIPIALATASLLYIGITLLLRFTRRQ